MQSRIQLTSIDVIASALEPVIPSLDRLSSPDGAITLMLSDIANANVAAEQLGPERWDRMLSDHRVIIDRTVAHHDGQVVKFERDGFFASFNSAHGGLHAAVELQRTFTGSADTGVGASGAPDGLAIRVGLHSGFVMGNPEQLMGRNVVLASRIAAQAKGGEILVSSALKQYTETDPSFEFEEHGEFHFKGLLGEHTLYRVRWR
jgi:class 3 adenylate cyclase